MDTLGGRPATTGAQRRTIAHPNGQNTAYIYDKCTVPGSKAETIMIQHGFARNADHFQPWVQALSHRYNIIRRELRGHGYSSYPKPGQDYDYSAATILDEIKNTLDQLGLQKVHFMGESTSGMLAEMFAATYPDRVSSITVCSSPTHLPLEAQQFLAFGMESWPIACRKLGSRGWAERLAAAPGTVASDDPEYVKAWVDQVALSSGEGLAGYAELLCKLDARPCLTKIEVPMLILAPTNSALVTMESMENLAAQVPTSTLRPVESHGHEIYLDAAEACQQAVLDFLAGLPSS